jgi:hypothetical protein
LLPSGALLSDVSDVRVQIYRVFPTDSDVTRRLGRDSHNPGPHSNEFARRR